MKELYNVYIVAVMLFVILGCAAALAAGKIAKKPGIYEEVLTLKNGGKLRYTLSLPASYSQQPVPLVIALHYGGYVTPYYGKGVLAFLVEPALRELSPIVAAPDCPTQGWDNPTSETAIMELVDYLKDNYHIDSKRVVVTGFSMGGIGSWYMAARRPDVFSAAIPIAGSSDAQTVKLIGDIPIYVIHSRADTVLPIAQTEKIVAALKEQGKIVEFVVLQGIDHYDTSGFTQALKGAVPWLKKTWSESNRESRRRDRLQPK